MATIALYSSKMNIMPSLISDLKSAVQDLKMEFRSLSTMCKEINRSVCDLDDVIRTISTSTQTQDEKIFALESLNASVKEFAGKASRIDGDVADYVNGSKDDFYDKYSYLKPECEKNGWDKFCDGCKKVGEWCCENWEALCVLIVSVVAIVAVIALSIVTFGATAVLVAALVGAVVGLAGQLIGDTIGYIRTGKWSGSIADYIGSMFGGAIGGILMLTGNATAACAVDGALSSLLSDSISSLASGDKKSLGDMLLNASVSAAFSAGCSLVLGKITDKLCRGIAKKIPALKRLSGRGSYSASFTMVLTKLKNGTIKNFSWKTIRNGVIAGLSGDFFKNILSGFGIVDFSISIIKKIKLPQAYDNTIYIPSVT